MTDRGPQFMGGKGDQRLKFKNVMCRPVVSGLKAMQSSVHRTFKSFSGGVISWFFRFFRFFLKILGWGRTSYETIQPGASACQLKRSTSDAEN